MINISGVQSAWDIRFIKIENQEYTLGAIEHKILRKKGEPRIHFAINCASFSCPNLLREAFSAEKLDAQLTEVGDIFMNDPSKNKISPGKIKISKIFSWFKGDFTKSGTLISFLNKFSKVKINEDANISYMEYNWDLNDQP